MNEITIKLIKEVGPLYAIVIGMLGILSFVVRRIIHTINVRLEEDRKERAEIREVYNSIIHNHLSELDDILQKLTTQVMRLGDHIEIFSKELNDKLTRLSDEIRRLNGRLR